MTVGERADPYLSTRFRLRLNQIDVGGFSEVTGLEASMQPADYQEGGVNDFTHKLPTRIEYANVSLKRGVTDSHELWGWLDDARNGKTADLRRTVQVFLQNRAGKDVRGWEVQAAYPIRWAGPELKADQGAVAIETLELAHHGLHEIPLSESGGGGTTGV